MYGADIQTQNKTGKYYLFVDFGMGWIGYQGYKTLDAAIQAWKDIFNHKKCLIKHPDGWISRYYK